MLIMSTSRRNAVRGLFSALVSLFLFLGNPQSLYGQDQPTVCDSRMTTIRFDERGLSSGRFLNPLAPYPLVPGGIRPPIPSGATANAAKILRWNAAAKCLEKSVIELVNEDASQTLIVTLSFPKKKPPVGSDTKETVVATGREPLAKDSAPPPGVDAEAQESAGRPDAQAKALEALVSQIQDVLKDGGATKEDTIRISDDTLRQRAYFEKILEEEGAPEEAALRISIAAASQRPKVQLDLESKGMSQEDAKSLASEFATELASIQKDLEEAGLESSVAQRISREVVVVPSAERAEEVQQSCETGKCTVKIVLAPGVSLALNGNVLSLVQPLDRITILVELFNENRTVTNRQGYLYAGWKLNRDKGDKGLEYPEDPSKVSWKFSGFVGLASDPELLRFTKEDEEAGLGKAGKIKPITVEEPNSGKSVEHSPARARLEVTQNLGNRAVAEATLQFKSGDLGEKETTRDVVVPTYRVQMNSSSGFSLYYGQYSLAKPTNSIAISESGEAYEVRGHGFSAARIIRRESEEGVADSADDDSEAWLIQVLSVPLKNLGIAGGVASFYYLDGRDAKDSNKHSYFTAGVDGRFGSASQIKLEWEYELAVEGDGKKETKKNPQPVHAQQFSLGYYHSERKGLVPQSLIDEEKAKVIRDGQGNTALLTYTYTRLLKTTKFKPPKTRWSGSIFVGQGSGDDPATEGVDEGYIGENAGFAPDKLFLSTFAKNLDAGDIGQLGAGLSNKVYVGARYEDARFTPLRWIAKGLFNQNMNPELEKSILSAHYYRAREGFGDDKELGLELNLDFEIEIPKGLRTTVGIGKLFRGEAIKGLLLEDPWSASVQVSVAIK